jgi:hypothetical protein
MTKVMLAEGVQGSKNGSEFTGGVSCGANPHPGTSLQLLNPQCLYGSAPHVYASHISLNMHFATT